MGILYKPDTPFKSSECVINQKAIKDLSKHPFNSDLMNDKEWHDLMRDHMLSANH